MTQLSPWSTYRAYTKIKPGKAAKGTARRILRYARPYRRWIAWFITLVVLDSLLIVATPLLLKKIIDDGVIPGDAARSSRARADRRRARRRSTRVLTLVQRWYSARIGEGLIYDLRTQVYDHVQRMPIAFFTRAQTGALVSRLNSDVIGAQRAFTSTLSGVVANVVSLVLVARRDALPVLADHAASRWCCCPVFVLPAQLRRAAGCRRLTRESMELNAEMSTTMTERFNVAGALLVKLFGRPAEEAAGSPTGPGGCATSASRSRCTAGSSSPR